VSEKDLALAAIAASHHGIFSRQHARQCGFAEHEIDARTSTGRWLRLHQSALRDAAAPATWRGELLAACWAGGFRAYVSHRAAAALWDLPGGRRGMVEITCPRWRRSQHASLTVHETKAFHGIDIVQVDRIPVTTPARTLVDLGAVASASVVELAVDRALNRGLASRDDLERALRRLGRSGRNGVGVLRSILRQRGSTLGRAASPMETRVLQTLRRHGLPTPELQYEIHHRGQLLARADAAYPQWRLAIEYDSDEFHTGVHERRRDSDRRNALIRAGWIQVTAHAGDIATGGTQLVRTIRARAAQFGVRRPV
jgi:hypothetical protein